MENGIRSRPEPLLRKLDNIECRDALVNADGSRAKWPKAEFIIGNPPFLGVKKLIAGLGERYVKIIRAAYAHDVSPFSDLVCWWFAKAKEEIGSGVTSRAGFVATSSITGGKNRLVLDDISNSLRIYDAWSREPWVLDGASVSVSIVCFCAKTLSGHSILLNDHLVDGIYPDLTEQSSEQQVSLTTARRLKENASVSFMATIKGGAFDVSPEQARSWLKQPHNANGRPNSDVLKRWINGMSIVRRPQDLWVIDFGELSEKEASFYEKPFEFVRHNVKPQRDQVRKKQYRENWWKFAEPCNGMRRATAGLERYIVTPTISKYRIFAWADASVLADHALIVIADDQDEIMGVLQSRFHEAWALRLRTSLEDRPRYTPTTTFETFPLPEGISLRLQRRKYINEAARDAIANASRNLMQARENWLNPSDLVREEPAPLRGYKRRLVPMDADAEHMLATRTLTALYNDRPSWLDDLHHALDAAVAEAYGWPANVSTETALSRLLELNASRSAINPIAIAANTPSTAGSPGH